MVRWTDRLMYTSKLINSFNLALAVVVAALLWRSLDWRVVGDAAIFHFIAVQMQMGAVPYRDIVDINMPLIYLIHAAIVTIGGVGDVMWRVFDLTAAGLMSGLILMLVWPAGRAAAIHAVLIVLVIHLLLGPYAAGQRDYLMSIPALGAALASAKSAERVSRPLALPGAGGRVRRERDSDQAHRYPANWFACSRKGRAPMARRGLERGRSRHGGISIARVFGT